MPDILISEVVVSGLCFAEGPRWHDGQLWFSDMHGHQVYKVDSSRQLEAVVKVDNWPSGLGWLPNGDLLVVSMLDRRVLRWDGKLLSTYADLTDLASSYCNDMVVDRHGRAYVGNFGFDVFNSSEKRPAELILVKTDGSAEVVAQDLMCPNGTVITPDDRTLIVAESYAARLTAFDINSDGTLTNRRVWAQFESGVVPDGISLDSEGGIWVAFPRTKECKRVLKGGEVTHQVHFDRGVYACMLGDQQLFCLTSLSSKPDICTEQSPSQIEVCMAPYPAADRQ